MASRTPYDTHTEEVINYAKFDAATPGSFGRFKTDRHTEIIPHYILEMMDVDRHCKG